MTLYVRPVDRDRGGARVLGRHAGLDDRGRELVQAHRQIGTVVGAGRHLADLLVALQVVLMIDNDSAAEQAQHTACQPDRTRL